jgi:hypothetical protein
VRLSPASSTRCSRAIDRDPPPTTFFRSDMSKPRKWQMSRPDQDTLLGRARRHLEACARD